MEKVPFQPVVRVPPEFTQRTQEIRRLDHELDRFVLNVHDYLHLVTDAYASNVHYSTELEGNPLDLEEVARLTRDSFRGDPALPLDAPRQEILNHLISWLAPEAYRLPWTELTIRGVHRFLTDGIEAEGVPGAYRTTMAPILDQDDNVVFAPSRPERIAVGLQSLLQWFNEQAGAYHPLAAATVFFHEFESIHPFRDGNGRTGRTLFHLYLHQGLKNANLCKIEAELLQDRELYYRLLSWTDERQDYQDLLDHFVDCTLRAYRAAWHDFAKKDLLSTGLDEHAKRLLVQAKVHKDWFSVKQASGWVDDIGDATVRKHLNRLVEMDVLVAKGQTSGKRYRFADPMALVRENLRKLERGMRASLS